MESKVTWTNAFILVAFLASLVGVLSIEDRTESVSLFSLYSASFASYWYLINRVTISFKTLLITAAIAHLVAVVFLPSLSIDFYRFLWDGELAWLKINPFDFRPVELAHQSFVEQSPYLQELYDGCGYMSQRNYTVYPTVNQLYFILSTVVSDDIYTNTIILKSLIVVTEFIGAWYLFRLLNVLQITTRKLWVLFLNPLWIIETVGNAHFEGVMISFLIIALYHLVQKNYTMLILFFTIAVQVKLVPLMLLPFFLRYIGVKKSIFIYVGIVALFIGSTLIFIDASNLVNFYTSLRLYFKVFEFNSFALYYTIQLGELVTGWNQIQVLGPLFSLITLYVIGKLSLKKGEIDWRVFFLRMTMGYLLYLLLSSTMHPWYILPLLFLSIFTSYSFMIVWSGVIFFSYIFYQTELSTDITYRIVVFAEYTILLWVIYRELKRDRLLLPWLSIKSDQELN